MPIYLLYEISIHLVRTFEKKREQELRDAGLWVDDDEEDWDDEEEDEAALDAEEEDDGMVDHTSKS